MIETTRLQSSTRRLRARWSAMLATVCASACSQTAASNPGEVVISIQGDGYVTTGVPSSAFADGWTVKYAWYGVSLSDFRIGDTRGSVGGETGDGWLAELGAGKSYKLVTMPGVPAQAWERVSFTVRPPGPSSRRLGVSEVELQQMSSAGNSVLVDATASKSGVSKHLRWGFARTTQYDWCEATVGGKRVQGLVVAPGGVEAVELIVHGEHLFYDDLQSQQAVLRFDPIAAADADNDGELTLDELAAVKLVEIAVGTYGTGSAAGINTLREFVTAQAQSVVHYRGNGGCISTTLASTGR